MLSRFTMRWGSHVAFSRAEPDCIIDQMRFTKLLEAGATAAQIYTGPKTQWINTVISKNVSDKIKASLQEYGIELWVHASLLPNLCRDEERCRKNLVVDMQNAYNIGARGSVAHVGKNVDSLRLTKGQATKQMTKQIVKTVELAERGTFVLETSSGQGTELCTTIPELALVTRKVFEWGVRDDQFKLCIDLCHVYNAGMVNLSDTDEIDTFWHKLEEVDLAEHIILCHFNNSKNPFGSRLDRHALVNDGYISNKGMRYFAQTCDSRDITMITETGGGCYDWLTLWNE